MAENQLVPSPPQPASRWPGLVAALGGEAAIRNFTTSNDGGDPGRWERGITFEPNLCGGADNTPQDGCGTITFGFDSDDCPAPVEATSYVFWTSVKRSTFNTDDVVAQATTKLSGTISYKLEKEWWTGAAAQAYGYTNQYLTDANVAQINGGTAIPLTYALARLQATAGATATGQRLFIYATPELVTLWLSAMVIRKENGLLLDAFDNIIVAGTGFDGSSPAGAVDATHDTSWAYATLQPAVRLGDVETKYVVDQTNNVKYGFAYRAGVLAMDPCVQYGVNVDMCTTCCTPAQN